MNERKPRVLLVDDEPDILRIMGQRLEMEGFDVLVAKDGEEALAQAQQDLDVIVLDLTLPKRSGLDVCRVLREERRYDRIPIVFFTSKEPGDVIERLSMDGALKEWGAQAYVNKSEGAGGLIRAIREVLAEGGV